MTLQKFHVQQVSFSILFDDSCLNVTLLTWCIFFFIFRSTFKEKILLVAWTMRYLVWIISDNNLWWNEPIQMKKKIRMLYFLFADYRLISGKMLHLTLVSKNDGITFMFGVTFRTIDRTKHNALQIVLKQWAIATAQMFHTPARGSRWCLNGRSS